jgi:putative FmdB family regulatory protein
LPTYEYRCDGCEKNFDVVQSFHDDPLATCPTCGSPVRKVFGNVGIVFKGSGFYKTDSRAGGASKAPSGDASPAGTSGADGSGADGSGSDSGTPATTPSGDGATKTSTTDSNNTASTPPAPAAPAKTSSSKESES